MQAQICTCHHVRNPVEDAKRLAETFFRTGKKPLCTESRFRALRCTVIAEFGKKVIAEFVGGGRVLARCFYSVDYKPQTRSPVVNDAGSRPHAPPQLQIQTAIMVWDRTLK